MKKALCAILAAVIALSLSLFCTGAPARADETPQPEGGKKFETNWAIIGETVRIVYEEEGYRVQIRNWDPPEMQGIEWEYSCFYNEEKDALLSVSSCKHTYTLDPDTFDQVYQPDEYDDLDDESTVTVFTIDGKGNLLWQDGRGDAGADLEFTDIGRFDGVWRSGDGTTTAEIEWDDSEENYGYRVFVREGDDDCVSEYSTTGLYDPKTGRLETAGTLTILTKNEEGAYNPESVEELQKLVVTGLGDGRIRVEKNDGSAVELEYDIDGETSAG